MTKLDEQQRVQEHEDKMLYKLSKMSANGIDYEKLNKKFEGYQYRQPIDNDITFKNFVSLFQNIDVGGSIRPKLINLNGLIKGIECIYTLKYEIVKANVKDNSETIDGDSQSFYSFVFQHLSVKSKGNKRALVQVYNLLELQYSEKSLEVDIFSKFLCDIYNSKELLFYLFIRNKVEEEMDIKINKLAHNQRVL